MTQSTLTAAQLQVRVSQTDDIIRAVQEHLTDLLNCGDVDNDVDYVIGYLSMGMYLGESGMIGNVLSARLFDAHTAARHPTVRNLTGMVAQVVTMGAAIREMIKQHEDGLTSLWGIRRDLEAELCGLLDAAADEAAYYDQFDGGMAYERERHP